MRQVSLLWVILALILGGILGWVLSSNKTLPSPAFNATTLTRQEADFKSNIRKLWEDHIVWTKLYIESVARDDPNADKVAGRLLKNQEEIGQALKPYYGEEAGNKVTQLLKDHILIAADLVITVKTSDTPAASDAEKRWNDNAQQISAALSGLNPNWPQKEWEEMLGEHLSLTKQEAANILNSQTEESITTFDKIHEQALKMADFMADGTIKQFPGRFGR